jgi:PKD repeat protein
VATLVNQFQFVDRSFRDPQAWAWDFGDGLGASSQQNPSYTFPSTGPALYLVRLTASAPACGGADVSDVSWHPVAVRDVDVFSGAIVTGITYLGTLKWFGFYPYTYSVFDGTDVPERYLLKTPSGSNARIEYISDYASSVIGSVTMTGIAGSLVVSPINGSVSGTMFATETLIDNFCNGLSWRNAYGGSTATVSFPVTGASMIEQLIVFYGRLNLTPTVKQYIVAPTPAGGGYMITLCGNGIWGSGTMAETLSNRMTVAQAAAAGGAVQIPTSFRSSTTSYDTGTSTLQGELTTLNIGYIRPSTTGEFVVNITYDVVPIGGGPTTQLVKSYAQVVGVGGNLNLQATVPIKVGYTVTLNKVEVIDVSEFSDDFEQANNADWFGNYAGNYPLTDFWSDIPTFGGLVEDAAADWEDVATQATLLNDPSGYGAWNGPGTFSSVDYGETSDDFETYPAGDLGLWSKGLGWVTLGYFETLDYPVAFDDFETYAVGTITSFTNTSLALGQNQNWTADGSVGVRDYTYAFDDFESYSTGAITSLNAGGGSWNGNGTFGT